jgi:hypothetical protein
LRCFDAEGSQYVPVYGIDLRPDNKLLPAVFRVVGKKPGKRPDDLFFFTRKLLFVFFQFPEDQAEKVQGQVTDKDVTLDILTGLVIDRTDIERRLQTAKGLFHEEEVFVADGDFFGRKAGIGFNDKNAVILFLLFDLRRVDLRLYLRDPQEPFVESVLHIFFSENFLFRIPASREYLPGVPCPSLLLPGCSR